VASRYVTLCELRT